MDLPDIENIPESGAVFTIGRSRFADNIASHFFIRKDPVISVTCGDEHSAVICQSGRLFVFGSNDWGQLGLGHKNHVSKPSCVKILKPEKVTHVACGRAHTLICTAGQKIFACGSDQEGQLGRGSNAVGDSSSSPVMVHDCGIVGPKVIQLSAGSHHSMILTGDGSVYVWGSNLEGQLGLPGTTGLVNKPTKVQIPDKIKQISAGYYHSAFLTESGLVYICGESESGKLGIDVKFSTQAAPKQIQLPKLVTKIACGGHHTLILTEDGGIYCMGSNSSGQLGLGTNVTELQTPNLLPLDILQNEMISKISCGESHSAILTDNGKIFTCGDGRHGKLGLEENENNVHELTFAARYQDLFVTNVSCGGCHTILIGRRRDSSIQMDPSAQKKNPLPPLKVPINRLQTGNYTEQVENESTQEIDTNTDKIKDEAIKDTETSECAENNKTSSVDIVTMNVNDNSTKNEEIAEKNSPNIEDDNIEEKADIENNEKENMESLMNTMSSDPDTMPIENEKSKEEKEKVEDGSEEIAMAEERIEKPISPPIMKPPPKPPRQKSGTESNSSTLPSTPVKNDDSELITEIEERMVNELKEDTSSIGSVDTQKTRSATSERRGDEQVTNGMKNGEEKINKNNNGDEEKIEDQDIIDDADDVQLPASKTGKMSRLFKSKKQQEAVNGTKELTASNLKSKSRTCTLL
ncbi:X-linked retinitis pigmentosa GTPase regulator-like [Leptopilina boulardi]|uniref:X-linked retinitis pigmentosa GTPase regulator-like n=1 Tax=Leptopilina boulardi TaxID=63433 RepID=UPI0021F62E27|nr:X-linked retinitis pigmentosa GTPase regulator-like [Leptopilina boulardi]